MKFRKWDLYATQSENNDTSDLLTLSTRKTDNFSTTSTDLVVQSAPAGEHGVFAEAGWCAGFPAPPGGRV